VFAVAIIFSTQLFANNHENCVFYKGVKECGITVETLLKTLDRQDNVIDRLNTYNNALVDSLCDKRRLCNEQVNTVQSRIVKKKDLYHKKYLNVKEMKEKSWMRYPDLKKKYRELEKRFNVTPIILD